MADQRWVQLKSFAVGGATARDLIETQIDRALLFDPDIVFVSVGANDAIKGTPLRRFRSELDQLIEQLAAGDAVVVQSGVGDLGTIPRLYPPLRNLVSRKAERYDRVHWEVARRHGTIVVNQRGDDLALWYRDRSLWAADLFHVSARGHERWAELAWKAIDPILNGAHGSG